MNGVAVEMNGVAVVAFNITVRSAELKTFDSVTLQHIT